MFRDGNNQAMGFIIQGYSDTIKVDENKALGNSFRDFNKSISDSLDTYHKNEANKAATKAQQLQNEYSQNTMNDRVDLVGQQLRSAKLTNDYSQNTMNDRVGMVGQQHKAMQHQNDITARTKDAQVAAMNAGYVENKANSDYNTTIKNLQHEVYKPILQAEKDDKGNYWLKQYENGKETGKMAISEAEYNRRKAINEGVAQANYAVNENERVKRQGEMYSNMANASMNARNVELAEMQRNATQNVLKAARNNNMNDQDIVNQLYEGGPITIGDNRYNPNILIPYRWSESGGFGGVTTNVNTSNLPVIEKKTNAARILLDEESSPEQKQQARLILQQYKQYEDTAKAIYQSASILSSFKDLLDKDRLKTAISAITQYFNGGTEFARMDANTKKVLAEIGTASMKGSLTNYELKIAKGQVPSLWESQHATMHRIHVGLGKVLNKIEGHINAMGEAGHRVLSPEVLQQYNGIKSFYEAISHNVEK